LARQVRRNNEALAGYAEAMRCDLGDFAEYAELRRSLTDRESGIARERAAERRAAVAASLEQLKPGDVIMVPSGRRAGLAVVVEARTGGRSPDPVVLTIGRQLRRLTPADVTAAVKPLDRMRIPRTFNARSPQSRRDLAASLRNLGLDQQAALRTDRRRAAAADDAEIARLRAAIRQHPCHACPDREDHARWAERHARLRRDTDGLERRMQSRTGTLGRMFDRVCDVLTSLRYLEDDAVTPRGQLLARLYSEADLVVAEALTAGLWDSLDPAELAAVVSALVYETRRDDEPAPRMPPGRCRQALAELASLTEELRNAEADVGLDFLRPPDPGFAWTAWRWANGHPLDAVLSESTLGPGDFVRWTKQLIDLLDQIHGATAADSPVRRRAREAMTALNRSVVAYSGVA
jgi:ATP-dependent RNA helicase HelY